MFARREPDLLRKRLAEVDRDERLGKLSAQASTREKVSDTSGLFFAGVGSNHGLSFFKEQEQFLS